MANICSFEMRLRGKRTDIESFYNALTQQGDIWMGRGACGDLEFEDNDYACIVGYCKWSIVSALIDCAISMKKDPNGWYFGDHKPSEFITLWEACRKWNLDMEVYSEEGGMGFQEHFICSKGNILCEDCVEWADYYLDDYETKEEAEEELGVEFTDEEWDNRYDQVTRGGFKWNFEI